MTTTSPPGPTPLARADLYTVRTADAVRNLIVGGHYMPGERVNEAELATSLGISRGPLREALQHLASEGLVHRVAHRGTFVPRFSAEETVELYELREGLEVMAARLAAQRADAVDLAALHELLDDTSAVLDAGTDNSYPANLDFHQRILALAGNAQLLQRAREVHRQLQLVRSRSGYRPDRAKQAYAEHVAVVAAIESGDPEAAERAMRAHLHSGFAHVRVLLDLDSSLLTEQQQ